MDELTRLKKFWHNKSVFLTGHTGFKGVWFSIFLNLMGAKVYGYALKAKRKSLFNIINKKIFTKSFIGDIRNLKIQTSHKNNKTDIIFHFAAQSLVTYSFENPKETFETNTIGIINLFDILKRCTKTKTVVILTTDKINKDNNKKIYKENDELGGSDPYSASKVCKEFIVSSYVDSFFCNTNLKNRISICRSGNVIGSGDYSKNRLLPDVLLASKYDKQLLLRNPNHVRPWQHVIEPLYGYLLLAEKLYNGTNNNKLISWNFGPDKSSFIKVSKVIKIFEKITKNNLKIKFSNNKKYKETEILKLNNSKSKKFLKWKPRWDVKETLKKQ